MTTPDTANVYTTGETLPDPLPADPMPLAKAWLDEAWARKDQPNPNAMTIASADAEGWPSARIVLCKAFHPDPGFIVFYTNYNGKKGRDLTANPHAAAVFHWDHTDRQLRLEGPVVPSPADESDAYYASRALESRIGAWASDQSEPIESRDDLLAKVGLTAMNLGVAIEDIESGTTAADIQRPPHWGGFRLWPTRAELWCGGTGRVHDRAEWRRELTPATEPGTFAASPWIATRIQP